MDLIREVKQRVDIVKVAEYYGLKLDRAYKCVCPFHKEKTASFSISPRKQIWHCFGCDKGGDAISLVSELLNINNYQAAKSINDKLGLGIDTNQKTTHFEINKYKVRRDLEEKFKQWENNTFQLLCDYLHLMWHWEEEKAPKSPDDEIDELFVEAMHNRDYIEYLIDDIFINGTNEDKIWFWKHEKTFIKKIEKRVSTLETKKIKREVYQYDLQGNFINKYNSVKEAGTSLGVNRTNIANCCRGLTKTAYGFVWRYTKESG